MPTAPALVVSGLTPADGERAGSDIFQAALTDYQVAAVDEMTDDTWRVFFLTAAERDRAAASLPADFPALTIQSVDIEDEDWAARSQANLRAIRVGHVIVAPPWDVPTTIVIQPSTGFGTGHHATTRLCLAMLQRLELDGRSVLDVGTGSGVLAIAASRLGASEVTAVDDDPDAVRAAWDNLALNQGAIVSLVEGDFRRLDLPPADIIIANLTGALLNAAAVRLRQLTNARGTLVLSGFMTHEERDVVAAYSAFSVSHREEEDGWVAVMLE